MHCSTPAQRQELRQHLRDIAAVTPPPDRAHYGHANEDNPITIFAERAMADLADPDTQIMRQAVQKAETIRAVARSSGITLDGPGWVVADTLGEHVRGLTNHFNRLSFSPAYFAWKDDCLQTLVTFLCADAQFRDMCRDWHDYSTAQRIDTATWFSRTFHAIFSADLIPQAIICVRDFERPPSQSAIPRLVRGTHQAPHPGRRSHDIGFNTHKSAGFYYLENALEVAFHENLHAVQYGLAGAAARGEIKDDHPLYRDARLFAMAFRNRVCYLPNIRPAYRAHPLEVDTHSQSSMFIAALRAA